ncbi:MAG: hypothetical protein JKX78_10265 [Alteromonadaceae bacterium]|nr:hypothetical protein [Alteromonadaceae bacterium]
MEFSTPDAIRQIRSNRQQKIMIDGHSKCQLEAMTFAINYHRLHIIKTHDSLTITGAVPVIRNDKFLINP